MSAGDAPGRLLATGSFMKRFDTRTYSISDFIEWRDRDVLDFSPDFQRRYVWSENAKSYLVDTVVREMPMPKLIISQSFKQSRQVRIVVDGQQRIRTLLGYYDNAFPIKRMHNRELEGRFFGDLTQDQRQLFLKYELGVDVLFDASYEELIEIFARINTYTVKLNPQELRNAIYLGYFKQSAFSVGKRYASYWLSNKVLKAGGISRMAEADFASNLLIVCLDGIVSNKVVDNYYKNYEEVEGGLPEAVILFDRVMSCIGQVYPAEEMVGTIWTGEPLFYSMFAAIRNCIEEIPVAEGADSILSFDITNTARLRSGFDSLSAEFQAADEGGLDGVEPRLARFVDVSRRRTADVGSRLERTRYIADYFHRKMV